MRTEDFSFPPLLRRISLSLSLSQIRACSLSNDGGSDRTNDDEDPDGGDEAGSGSALWTGRRCKAARRRAPRGSTNDDDDSDDDRTRDSASGAERWQCDGHGGGGARALPSFFSLLFVLSLSLRFFLLLCVCVVFRKKRG